MASSDRHKRVSMPPGRPSSTFASTIMLVAGKFYKSRDGELWCCFKVDMEAGKHCQARCIRIDDERVEYFYLDGRYDESGKREHTLVKEA
jgi:hypothetical protein